MLANRTDHLIVIILSCEALVSGNDNKGLCA